MFRFSSGLFVFILIFVSPEVGAQDFALQEVGVWPLCFFNHSKCGIAGIKQSSAYPVGGVRSEGKKVFLPHAQELRENYLGLLFSVVVEKFQNVFQLSTRDYPSFDGKNGS